MRERRAGTHRAATKARPGSTDAWASVKRLLDQYETRDWWPLAREWHAKRGTEPLLEVCWGAVLAQGTSWANVERALANLRAQDLMTPAALRQAPGHLLLPAIRPSGFFLQKMPRLVALAHYLHTQGASTGRKGCLGRLAARARREPEAVRAELRAIKGIGPETADTILLYALDVPVFVIDAYTKRLLRRIGQADEKGYERWRAAAEAAFPPDADHYRRLHAAIVEHCKAYCRTDPACAGCPVRMTCLHGRGRHHA